LKWFTKGSTEPIDYDGPRDAIGIARWINEKTGLKKYPKIAPSAVTVLTDENFDTIVDGSKGVLVEFYAPWVCIYYVVRSTSCNHVLDVLYIIVWTLQESCSQI
jgi:hypothetical protein